MIMNFRHSLTLDNVKIFESLLVVRFQSLNVEDLCPPLILLPSIFQVNITLSIPSDLITYHKICGYIFLIFIFKLIYF